MKEAVKLAEYLRDLGYMPEQVQDFYPTPSTISTCMYYTGVDPRTMKPVYVPKNPHEKAMQRALIQYRNPKNYDLVMEALRIADRMDLVGFDEKCLIRPRKLHSEKMQEKNGYSGRNHGGTHGGTDRKSKNPNGNNKNPGKTNGNYKNSNAGHKIQSLHLQETAEASPRQDRRKRNPSVMYTNGSSHRRKENRL